MKIDFGRVEKYIKDKGFGFVSHTLNPSSGEVFFHIKNIRRTQLETAKSLENENSSEAVYFWYEFEDTHKGEQVKSVLSPNSIHEKFKSDLPIIIEKIERIWKNVNPIDLTYLYQVTEDILGTSRTIELSSNRKNLEIKEKEEYLKKLIKEENLRKSEDYESVMLIGDLNLKIEIENTKDRLSILTGNKSKLLEIENNEFKQLIEEVSPLEFSHSKQLSLYIIKNRLGDKYKNISGVLKMEKEGNTWGFNGGFPTNIYRKICEELGLENEGSDAKVVGFKSFKELNND